MSYRSPSGEPLRSRQAYLDAWDAEAQFFAEWMGWTPSSFDPNFTFTDEDGMDHRVPKPIVLAVNKLLRRACTYRGALAGCHALGCPVHSKRRPVDQAAGGGIHSESDPRLPVPPKQGDDSPHDAGAPAPASCSDEVPG